MTNNSQSSQDGDSKFSRIVILSVICIPIIVGLIYFAYTKNEQAPIKTKECEKKCTEQGFPGYDFKWSIFSDSRCSCVGEQLKK